MSRCKRHLQALILLWLAAAPAWCPAAGTRAGTDIINQVVVDYEIAGEARVGVSNAAAIKVAEVIDLNVFVQTPERLVASGVAGQPLYFTATNTGNGTESFRLTPVLALNGDHFDPLPSASTLIIDSDGDGILSSTDAIYIPGTNEPVAGPDESFGVFIVADIPAGLADGLLGFVQLQVSSATATGNPGQVFAGVGDAGVDVVLGPGGGSAVDQGEYLVGEISLSVTKVASVNSSDGDQRVVAGALMTYTIAVSAEGTGSARDALFRDSIPQYTLFVPGSLRLNGTSLSDAADTDSGEFVAATPEVVVRLGELRPSDPAQVIEFSVNIE